MEFLGLNVQSSLPSEDFSVDDLLNFGNDDDSTGEHEEEEEEERHERKQEEHRGVPCSVSEEAGTESMLLREEMDMDINFPTDDLADLEWLSQFVDDSFDLPENLPEPSPELSTKPVNWAYRTMSALEVHTSPKLFFNTPVPGKARSKRSRTGCRVWSLRFGPVSGSPPSPVSCSSSGSLISQSREFEPGCFGPETALKKHKRKRPVTEATMGLGWAGQPVRRCSHCGVHKTPQWRAGPMGAKTLCNACGVRFKSGRLHPEYRPACSPTFSSELHSNHHRKVLEMRKMKGLSGQQHGPLPIVSTF